MLRDCARLTESLAKSVGLDKEAKARGKPREVDARRGQERPKAAKRSQDAEMEARHRVQVGAR